MMNFYCKVCNRPLGYCSGWDLCVQCSNLYEQGHIIRARSGYQRVYLGQKVEQDMIYEKKRSIQSFPEMRYYHAIKDALPDGYQLFPQVAVSAVIERTDGVTFRNELYRVFDFLVTDMTFRPVLAIELNDSTHNTYERRQRDINLERICGEAGIYLEMLPTGMGRPQIHKKVAEIIEKADQVERKPYIQKVVGEARVPQQTAQPVNYSAGYRYYQWSPGKVRFSRRWKNTLLLAIFLGWLGAHRYYVERNASAVLYTFTFGLFGLGWIIDILCILCETFKDGSGRQITQV